MQSFGDSKIQYFDINSAFHGHRFCERGHIFDDQINKSDKVYLWNNPARLFISQEEYAAASNSGSNGYIARTLHPTQDAHKAMGDIISQHLKSYYKGTGGNTIVLPNPCPTGCTCFELGTSCT